MADREMVSVDAHALRTVLQALIGPPHHIRELQMTRSVAALTGDDPIQKLLDDFNTGVVGGGPPRCDHCAGTGYAHSAAPCAHTIAGCAPDCHEGNRCRAPDARGEVPHG